jgi:hypothetical protein
MGYLHKSTGALAPAPEDVSFERLYHPRDPAVVLGATV